jgi:pimeloyl-ACP methyl ester carboxylesterase
MARFPALVAAMRRRVARTVADSEAGALLRELRLSTLDRMAERLPGTINDITQSRLPFAYPLEAISAPVLVVHGTADEAVPFAQARALSAKLPNAELLAIEGGQHVSIFTHRSEVRTRSMQFLNTHMPST